MTGKHWSAAAIAAGLALANGQNWASAQNTTDAQNAAQQAQQRTEQQATTQQGQQRSGEYQADGKPQNGPQWSGDQQGDRPRGEDRNRGRQGDRNWSERDRNRQSDIRFDRSGREGLVIASVGAGTPYYRSGLRDGDVIVSLGGRPLRSEDDFYRWSERGERVPVVVLRDGRRETVYIQYERNRNESRSDLEDSGSYAPQAYLGVRFEMRIRGGAVISAVVPSSPAEQAGLKTGDEIVAINGRQVETPRDATRIVESLKPGDRIDIEFARRSEQQTQAVLEEHPRALAGARYDSGVEQSSYDAQGNYTAPDENNRNESGYRTTERNGERRGGRILPRLRD